MARDSHLTELVIRTFEELRAIVPRDTYGALSVNLDLREGLNIKR